MGIAIITGASSGIGAQFARELAPMVDELWFVARRKDRMISLGEEIGKKYKVIEADLSVKDGIDLLKACLAQEKPDVKYLVNAAGFGDFGAFDELSESAVETMIDLNVKALVLITHITVPYMMRGGRIIELGSGSAFTPLPYFNVYAAGKAFVLHYSKALSYEVKKYGVSVTCFCPGWVHTEFIGKAKADASVTAPPTEALVPLLDCKKVVSGCVRAANRGKRMYVVGYFTKMQHLLYKLLPSSLLSLGWIYMMVGKNRNRRERGE